MIKRLLSTMAFVSIFSFLSGCSSIEEKTAQETKNREETSESRIVATTVSTLDILHELNLDVVGIPTTSSDIPDRYKGIQEVGNAMSPDVEIIRSLNPTDVLSVTTLEYDLKDGFNEASIPATFVNLQSIADMQESILELGKKYNREEEANKLAEKYTNKIEEIQKKIEGKESPKVLVLLGIPGSYLVATNNSYVGNLVELAGGTNVIQEASIEYLSSNSEYLYESNPDIIIRLSHGMPDEVVAMFDEEFQTNDIWKHFDAVKNNRVYDLEENLFGTTATIRADESLEELVSIMFANE